MIDLGVSKLALIAVVALVVIGPERLPKVARMAGNLLGRAQRYMAEVKSEVNRQVELDELKKMQEAATSAMKDVQSSVNQVESGLSDIGRNINDAVSDQSFEDFGYNDYGIREPKTNVRQGRSSWGVKKAAMPQWYKRSAGVKTRVQSGAARVKRFRRAAAQQRTPKSFF
ncbi:Sec-independent protein translocase subunit TatB [Polynucleobacter sp. 30F-ANTBAC]|jgi:sec-independent protein translocase protein TatB|uniref:Sec-independent protein translocase protein TatB n=1 Tax=Polynucleobacter sp. 30F-ANTBAC TaxID=2689095 RepID=UPI001C0D4778|nr:Sec-independent protein translocase protein TatB [Polynucleobacter sp. 30F-ANTBAC]MBU3599911.1 Sec-independent protein translocase subunit TatB [Polynucleobacter sp. 30F-ANTBAC]